MKKLFLLAVLIFLPFSQNKACDGCQCRVNQRGSGKFTLSLNFRHANFGQMYGSESVQSPMTSSATWPLQKTSNSTKVLHGADSLLNGSYERYATANFILTFRFNSRWSFNAIVPITKRSSRNVTAGGSESMRASGLSDIALLTGFNAFADSKPNYAMQWSFLVGFKLPTGKTNATSADGDLVDMRIQSGTGSVDYLFMSDISKQFNRFEFLGDFVYRRNAQGAHGFQFGDFMNYRLGARYRLFDTSTAIVAIDPVRNRFQVFGGINFDGEWEGRERDHHAVIPNTGGHTFLISPAVRFQWTKVGLGINYQIPVTHQLHGRQLGQTAKIVSEWSLYL